MPVTGEPVALTPGVAVTLDPPFATAVGQGFDVLLENNSGMVLALRVGGRAYWLGPWQAKAFSGDDVEVIATPQNPTNGPLPAASSAAYVLPTWAHHPEKLPGTWPVAVQPTPALTKTLTDAAVFGSGADGAVTFSSNATLTRSTNYTDATVNPGVTLDTGGFLFRGTGTLTNNGTVGHAGNAGGNAAGAAGGTAGAATAAGVFSGGGSAGSAGAAGGGTGAPASNPTTPTGQFLSGASGGTGGTGGRPSGSATPGGAGGTAPAPTALAVTGATWNTINYTGGGGGGGGGGNGGGANNAGGGGGGGAGGVAAILFANIVNNGSLTAAGGKGGNGAAENGAGNGGGGGGAGGGGGILVLVFQTLSPVGTTTAGAGTGGAAGADTSVNHAQPGAAGAVGTILQVPVVVG